MKKIIISSALGLALFLIVGCTPKTVAVPSTNDSTSTSEASSQLSNQNSSATSQKEGTVVVSLEEAIKTFEKKYPEAKITSIQLDTSLGHYFYEIEGVDNLKEYQIDVNADTGDFTKEKVETLDTDEQNGVKVKEDALDLKGIITKEKATEIAKKDVKTGSAKEWKLSKELGTTYWEVKVIDGTKKTEVKIDAHSGKILTSERDD